MGKFYYSVYTTMEFSVLIEIGMVIVFFLTGCLIDMFLSIKRKKDMEKNTANYNKKLKSLIESHKEDNVVFSFISSFVNEEFLELNEKIQNLKFLTLYDCQIKKNFVNLLIFEYPTDDDDSFALQLISSPNGQQLMTLEETIDVSNWAKEDILKKIMEILENTTTPILSMEKNEHVDFEIKNPKWQFIFFIIISILSYSAIITLFTLYFTHKISNMIAIVFLPIIFALGSTLGIYAYIREKFSLKKGIYTYRSLFKTQSCHYSEIDYVALESKTISILLRVAFYGKDGKKLISFTDDGTAFKDKKFLFSLLHYAIDFKNEVL